MAVALAGWNKVREIYPVRNFLKGCIKPTVLLLISVIAFVCSNKSTPTDAIKLVCNFVTSGFPSIIGFILTGYTLIIGFSGTDFLLKMAKSKADDKHTLFERVNSTFAFVTAFLVVTYIMACVVSYIEAQQIIWPFSKGCKMFNSGVLVVLLFFFYYSVCALLDIVMNVFNLGQLAHAVALNRLKAIEAQVQEESVQTEDKTNKGSFLSKFLNLFLSPN